MAAVATPPTALPMMSPNQAPIMGNPAATQAQPTVPTPTAVRPPLSPTNTSSSTMSGSPPSSPKHEWPDCTGSPTRTASKGIPALETPVYVLPSFVRDEQTIIVLKDSATMFDRRQCDVRDAHGKIILTVKEHLASLVNQKDILDPEGNLVYSVKNKRTSVKRTYEVVDPSGCLLFEARHTPTDKDKMSCVFRDKNSGQDARIAVRGKFHAGRADLILYDSDHPSGTSVAEVRHTVAGPKEVVKDPSTYFITVAAGVDLGLIATLSLCFDRMAQD